MKLLPRVLLAGMLAGGYVSASSQRVVQAAPNLPWKPGVVVVQARSQDDEHSLEGDLHAHPIAHLPHTQIYELALKPGDTVVAAVKHARRSRHCLTAEPDYLTRAPEASNTTMSADPKSIGAFASYIGQRYAGQWAAQALGVATLTAGTEGSGATIAVIDTGVQTTHPALQGHLTSGYDFLTNSPLVSDPAGGMDSGHGTFVAGLIALAAPRATIMPLRVLDRTGTGDAATVARAVEYAADHGARVINLSLGSYNDDQALDGAIEYAQQQGAVVVAAAGNDNRDAPTYPAATKDVLGVAATTASDVKAGFSNYGSYVAVSAPGAGLYSTYDNGAYATGDGTSFATPLVSAGLADAWSAAPTIQMDKVDQSLLDGSVNIDDLNPLYHGDLGRGRLDIAAAVSSQSSEKGRHGDGKGGK